MTFTVGAKGLGQVLDPSTDQNDLPTGSQVEVPFWMANSLVARNMVQLSVPKIFGEKVKRELLADATCVDLRDRSRYYFELGLKVSLLTNQTDVAMLVLSSFRDRYQRILTECLTISEEESIKYLPRLTSEERELFDAGRLSTILFKVWRQSRPGKIGFKRRRFY